MARTTRSPSSSKRRASAARDGRREGGAELYAPGAGFPPQRAQRAPEPSPVAAASMRGGRAGRPFAGCARASASLVVSVSSASQLACGHRGDSHVGGAQGLCTIRRRGVFGIGRAVVRVSLCTGAGACGAHTRSYLVDARRSESARRASARALSKVARGRFRRRRRARCPGRSP